MCLAATTSSIPTKTLNRISTATTTATTAATTTT
jgi:hypothetical protein